MVAHIICKYLVDKGQITSEQYAQIFEEQKKVRVKLGLIAVAEGLMMQMEADEVNHLQAVMDKRFGDIAVEQGYLTEKEVDYLLMKQGSEYLLLAQTLEDLKLMTLDQLEQQLFNYMNENNWGISDLEDLKSNDVDRILPLFIPMEASRCIDLAGVAMRMLLRRIDSNVFPLKGYVTDSFQANHYAIQNVEGGKVFSCAVAGMEDELILIAENYSKETFHEVDEDVVDAVAEVINCINGLYASSLSQAGVILELLPPEYGLEPKELYGENLLVFPMVIQNKTIHFVISMGSNLNKRQKG